MDAVGEFPQIGQQFLDVPLQFGEGVLRGALTPADLVAGQPELHHQRDDLLLHTVVDVALDAPPLRILGRDDAGPGSLQLVQSLGEFGRQLHVGDGSRSLPGQGGQQFLVTRFVAAGFRPALDTPEYRPAEAP